MCANNAMLLALAETNGVLCGNLCLHSRSVALFLPSSITIPLNGRCCPNTGFETAW